tara:strand:- start:50540 stop:52933 length:2394 start_codon:yes stop_codon:yes gene_type:complete
MLKKLFFILFSLGVVFGTFTQCSNDIWKRFELKRKIDNLYELGRYTEAIKYAKKEVRITKKEFGETTDTYAVSLNNLAVLYMEMGRYAKAELLLKQGLQISKTIQAENQLDYASFLNNIATLYIYIGRYTEAELMVTQAIGIRKLQLGENHPDYAESLNTLAVLYSYLGRYSVAEPLYSQAMDIVKVQLGEDHLSFTRSLIYMASHNESMGRYTETEPLYSQAVGILKEKLGVAHPEYAYSLYYLGTFYTITGAFIDAEKSFKEAILVHKNKLGESHPNIGIFYTSLAELYTKTNRFSIAQTKLIQAKEIITSSLGNNHLSFFSVLFQQAKLYRELNHFIEAKILFEQVLASIKAIHSNKHPNNAIVLGELARLYALDNQKTQAAKYYNEANLILKDLVGETHPRYLQNLGELAKLYQESFQYDKASIFYKEIQRISEEILKSGETDREQVPRNLQASGEASLKAADTRPFIGIFSPDPLQRNERGVNRLNVANFTIKGFATAAYGIKQLQVNGQKVPVFPDGVWQYPVKLAVGENEILIKAMANSGDETLDTLLLHYENKQVSRSEAPRRFLLTIGINEYNFESWPNLNMPVKDARDLIGALVNKYYITDIDTLFNQSASFANVKDRLKHLIGATRPQDEVIIFFAGHGEYDENFDEDGKWILANGRLGNASLAAVIEKMEAKHVLVLADACFSGSFYLKRGEGHEAAEARNQRRSRWVVASGSLENVLDQMPGKQNSPFAWHLIDFLQRATGDVTLSALRDYLETEVPKYTDQQPIAGPLKGDKGGELILRQLSN